MAGGWNCLSCPATQTILWFCPAPVSLLRIPRGAATAVPHPEPDHLGDRGLVLPQGTQVSLFLEGGDIVIDIEDVDPGAPRGLLAATVAGNDGQRVALRGLKVQPGRQDDHTRVLVQGEAEGAAKEGGKASVSTHWRGRGSSPTV